MSDGMPASEVRPRPRMAALASLTAPPTTARWGVWREAWGHWKKIAHAIGVVQTRMLMVILYFIIVAPLGLVMRMTADPLHLKPPKSSNWTPCRSEDPNLDTARRQF
jgi:hypothetical protein